MLVCTQGRVAGIESGDRGETGAFRAGWGVKREHLRFHKLKKTTTVL